MQGGARLSHRPSHKPDLQVGMQSQSLQAMPGQSSAPLRKQATSDNPLPMWPAAWPQFQGQAWIKSSHHLFFPEQRSSQPPQACSSLFSLRGAQQTHPNEMPQRWRIFVPSLHEKPFKACWRTGTIWGAINIRGNWEELRRNEADSERDGYTDEWSQTNIEQTEKDQQRETDLYLEKVWVIYKNILIPFGPSLGVSPEGIIGPNYFSERWIPFQLETISVSGRWSSKRKSETSRRENIWSPIQRKSFYYNQFSKIINPKSFRSKFLNLKSKFIAIIRFIKF